MKTEKPKKQTVSKGTAKSAKTPGNVPNKIPKGWTKRDVDLSAKGDIENG